MDLEDAKRRLNFNDVVVRCRCIAKLIIIISKKREKMKTSASIKIPELSLLLDTCNNDCYVTSIAASDGLVQLVQNKDIDLEFAITSVLSSFSSSKNPSAVIYVLTKLLLLNNSSGIAKEAIYSLQHPKHPLIVVLESKPTCWPLVVNSITEAITKHSNSFIVMEPVINYILMNPYEIPEHTMMRHSLLEKLITHSYGNDPYKFVKYIFQVLPWFQVFNVQQIAEAIAFLSRFKDAVVQLPMDNEKSATMEKLLFASLALCHNCLNHSYNPEEILNMAENISSHLAKKHKSTLHVNASLVLISALLANTSGSLNEKLLNIGHFLVRQQCPSNTVAAMLMAPVVQLLAEPNVLSYQPDQALNPSLTSFCKKLESFLNVYESVTSTSFDVFDMDLLEQFTSGASQAVLFAKFCAFLDGANNEMKIQWLTHVKSIAAEGVAISELLFHLIAGLFLVPTQNEDLFHLCLEVFEMVCSKERNSTISPKMFALLLYKLKMEVNPERHLLIMEYLAKTVGNKYAVSPVLNVFLLMAKTPELKAQAIYLMFHLCKKQERCFRYLQELLTSHDKTARSDISDIRISQAAVIKELCLEEPEAFGKESLGALSTIINISNDAPSTPAVVLALDGVIHLCKSEVIDFRSVWKNLFPKLSKDKRAPVIVRMCHLLNLVPALQVKSFEYEKFMNETSTYLWRLISLHADSPPIAGAAFGALAGYPINCYNLKQLPAAAKINLKLPASMVSTPFEMGKLPEDVLDYIPGYCFIDLLESIEESTVLEGYEKFLQSLVSEEIKELPRSVYSRRKLIGKSRNPNSILSSIPRILCSMKSSVVQKDLAVGILLSYEAPLETDREGKPKKQSVFEQLRLFEQVLDMLLNEVNLEINNWQRCLLLPSAWSSFMERAFFACEESRRTELDIQKMKGQLKESPDEIAAMYGTAWLWVRDRLLTLVKKNVSRNSTSSLANAMFAVTGLVRATDKFYSDLDNDGKQFSKDCTKHVSHEIFRLQCTETILSAFDSQHEPSSKVFSWLLTHLPKQTTNSGAIVKGCAAAALYQLLPIIQSESGAKINHICNVFTQNLSKENPSTLTIFSGIGLGYFIKYICQNTALECHNDHVDMILGIVENLDAGCKIEEFVSGKLIALTIIVSGMCLNGSHLFLPWIQNICESVQTKLGSADKTSMLYEFVSICSSSILASAASVNILPIQVLKNVTESFYEQQKEMPQCSSTAVSLGILVDSLVHLRDHKSMEMSENVQKVWLGKLASEKSLTLHRIAALNGLCTLFSSGNGLVQIDKDLAMAGNAAEGLKDLMQLLMQLLNATKSESLHGVCSWEMGKLFSIHSGQQDLSSTLPSSYSYLSERSTLKPLTAFIQETFPAITDGSKRKHVLCGLKSLGQSFPRPLPPLNWASFLSPFFQNSVDSEIVEACLKIALFQMPSSTSASSLLASHITPPLFYNLPKSCQLMLQRNIPALSSLPQSRLQQFLQVAISAPIISKKIDDKDVVPIIQSLLESIKSANSNEKVTNILVNTIKEIFLCLNLNSEVKQPWSHMLRQHVAAWPENMQDSFLKDLEKPECVGLLAFVLSYLVSTGKKPLKCLRPVVERGKHATKKNAEMVLANLLTCFISGATMLESDIGKPEKLIAFLLETMGWLKILTDSSSSSKHQLSSTDEVAVFLFDVCMTVIMGSAGNCMSYVIWSETDINHKILIQYLPDALNILCHNSVWNESMDKILDQLFSLRWSNFLDDNDQYYIQAAFSALRSAEAFKKPTLWTEIVPRFNLNG